MNKKDKKIKTGIVVLSVLLVISIVALICIMIKGCSAHSTTTTKNPGNIITLRSEANKSFQVTYFPETGKLKINESRFPLRRM